MNKFLRDGQAEKSRGNEQIPVETEAPNPSKEHSHVQIEGINTSSIEMQEELEHSSPPKKDKKVHEQKTPETPLLKETSKPSNPKKAKTIRLERKKAKVKVL